MTSIATNTSGRADTIENPVVGSQMTFLERSADMGGEYVLVEIVEAPHAQGPPLHIHPKQSETFAISEGSLILEVAGEEQILEAGDSMTVQPRQPHQYWNASDEQVRGTMELRPSGDFENFLETMAGLGKVGKVNTAGVPNLFQTAVILREHWDVFRLVSPPQWVQKPLFAVLAPVGRIFGCKPYYDYAELTNNDSPIDE